MPHEFHGQGFVFSPKEILDKREIVVHNVHVKQVIIMWNEGGSETATWEDVATIKDQFPDFNLEDKVVSPERSNGRQEDKEKVWKVYYRRKFKNTE